MAASRGGGAARNSRRKILKPVPVFIRWRYRLTLFFVFLALGSLFVRLAWIQLISPDRLVMEGDMRSVRKLSTESTRGMITDRNGVALAVSIPVKAVYCDPKILHDSGAYGNRRLWKALAEVLGIAQDEIEEKIANPKRRFVYLQRQVTNSVAEYIRSLKIDGIYVKNEYRRYYPTGEINAQLVGITNIDDHGIEGVERSFDDWLSSTPAEHRVRKDAKGRVIEQLGTVNEGKKGGAITLSIDQRLQSIAYAAVKANFEQRQASSISAVLVDVHTGEILAMVNAPSFNPNVHAKYEGFRARNRAITDTYEPGSTVKPIVAVSALEHRITNWNEIFDTRPFRVYSKVVTDSHHMASGNLEAIIKYSSNVGMARIALKMDPNDIVGTFNDFGLGVSPDLGLVGEVTGYVPHRSRWSEIEKATIGFGYGLRISPVQLALAYATIASGGVSRPLSILKLDQDQIPAGRRVADEKVMRRMIRTLETVVEGGTGKLARIRGYTVAGKTGTAKVAVAGGYGRDYVGTFAGFAPASNPRFALVVVVNEPKKGGVYGGTVAGPMFSEIMSAALQLYNVPPDEKGSREAVGIVRLRDH